LQSTTGVIILVSQQIHELWRYRLLHLRDTSKENKDGKDKILLQDRDLLSGYPAEKGIRDASSFKTGEAQF
jgi:hypothetical protein